MAVFDLQTFAAQTGTGVPPFQAVGTAFGIPPCILDFTSQALSLLPADVLNQINSNVQKAKAKANEVTSSIIKNIFFKTGIIEFDAENGTLKFKSNALNGLDADGLAQLGNLGGFVAAVETGLAFGAQLYTNYQLVANQLEELANCIQSLEQALKYQKGSSSLLKNPQLAAAQYAAEKDRFESAKNFIIKCEELQAKIGVIFQERELDPTKEPVFSDLSIFDSALSGTDFNRQAVDDTPTEPTFRLSFGPPISTNGYFLLTKDGLYYDSQTGGLNPIFVNINSKVIPDGEKWKYEHDPNLGGKGQAISLDQFNKYKNTLFDPDIIDDSLQLKSYYDSDVFLQNLIDQRDNHIYDLSSVLTTQLVLNSNQENSITKNMRLALLSEIANHASKIRRRKKQIEIAVKTPTVFQQVSGDPSYNPIVFKPGEIPINDFSYLNNFNFKVEFDKQRKLIFEQAEVSGIVLPIETKYALPPVRANDVITIRELIVPEVGIGDIIYSEIETSSTIQSLTDTVVTDGLFGIYNFLQADVVQPSSTQYNINNTAVDKTYNKIQLVANYASSVFVSGLSIPYLQGIVKNNSVTPSLTDALGSYARLPDTKEYQDLMYNPSGFTIECWVHAPYLTDGSLGWLSGTTSSLTRVLLGNENTGSRNGITATNSVGTILDLDYLALDRTSDFVRGFLSGFTRDRRITQAGKGYSNDNRLNDPVSSLSFFVAPTQSRDLSSCSWVNTLACTDETNFYKMSFDCRTKVNGKSFGDASGQFILVDIVGDPRKDEISLYCDGQLMTTSSISTVFGVQKFATIDLPSFKKDNSFEYSPTSVDGPKSVQNGPKLNPFYTPWIVGGGYTDGMSDYGNFMGGDRGGVVSGLRGFIGSLKFYSRPLNTSEVLMNYKAQQVYFKNILT